MERLVLENYLAKLLRVNEIADYCPNGLQVEGKTEINTIVTGVTASQQLIEAAIDCQADAVLVHHGYFWKGEPDAIVGMKKRRIAALLKHDINLFAYHLPLDVHEQFGNNVQLAELLDFPDSQPLAGIEPDGVVRFSQLAHPLASADLADRLAAKLARPLSCAEQPRAQVQKIAWCTGGGQGFIDQAAAAGCDAFITGEVSEQTIHSAREQSINFFAAGHHATERYGIQALGEHLAEQFAFHHQFIDIDNPA